MKKLTLIALGAVVLFLAAGAGVYATGAMNIEDASTPEATIEPEVAENALSDAEIEAALKERFLGDENAPLTISEHSSFTCGHCGNFHKNTFKPFKEAYVDTGKVKLVFSDFPLNAPALDASAVARCIDKDRYFDFVQLLFESQDQWAYSAEYKNFLRQNAQLAGLSAEKFDACINSDKLKEGILANVQATQEAHKISSTPSFVIGGKEVVSGSLSFDAFSKKVDAAFGK